MEKYLVILNSAWLICFIGYKETGWSWFSKWLWLDVSIVEVANKVVFCLS